MKQLLGQKLTVDEAIELRIAVRNERNARSNSHPVAALARPANVMRPKTIERLLTVASTMFGRPPTPEETAANLVGYQHALANFEAVLQQPLDGQAAASAVETAQVVADAIRLLLHTPRLIAR